MERRPSDDALIAALGHNDSNIRGLTKFDQQLVYVPLGVLAAVVSAVVTLLPGTVSVERCPIALAFGLVAALVLGGLARNHWRHEELLARRTVLGNLSGLPPEPPRTVPLALGRLIYAALFLIGWVMGVLTLLGIVVSL